MHDLERSIAYQIAAEGSVLLKNDDILPLKKRSKIALFGIGSLLFKTGGVGSGAVTSDVDYEFHQLMESYFEIEPNISKKYQEFYQSSQFNERDYAFSECQFTDDDIIRASQFTDTAIFVLTRNCGEGLDIPPIKGGYYLSRLEDYLIIQLDKHFKQIDFIVNSGVIIDYSFSQRLKSKVAVLNVWYPGVQGILACLDIVVGKINPSGHLTSTSTLSYQDYPTANLYNPWNAGYYWKYITNCNFGALRQMGICEAGWNLISDKTVEYREGIFVGYRFFSTFLEFQQRIMYPFGFGLSYTTFRKRIIRYAVDQCYLLLDIEVINTGDVDGKDVVQIYIKSTNNQIHQLAGFSKTSLIVPGNSEVIRIKINLQDISIFDCDSCVFKIPKGEYHISLNTSAIDVVEDIIISLPDYRWEMKNNYKAFEISELSSKYRNFSTLEYQETHYVQRDKCPSNHKQDDIEIIAGTDNIDLLSADCDLTLIKNLSIEELALLCIGDMPEQVMMGEKRPLFVPSIPGAASSTHELIDKRIPKIVFADGPCGLGLETPTCLYPSPCMQATTWNLDLLTSYGIEVGKEAIKNKVNVVLAPALNIQRSVTCGRNYEYFSEDPIVSGQLAAAYVRGIQSQGIGATLKHFAAHNVEPYRDRLNVRLSEKALREIYLRAFQIAIRESAPVCVMSAYNKINNVYCSENNGLLNEVLRREWKFDGCVMSDWEAAFFPLGDGVATQIKNGNDLIFPGGKSNLEELMSAIESGEISRLDLEIAASHILQLINRVSH